MTNYQLVETLHNRFIDQWVDSVVRVVRENPVEMMFAIEESLREARELDEIRPLHVMKWFGKILTSEVRDGAQKGVEIINLLKYFDDCSSDEEIPF